MHLLSQLQIKDLFGQFRLEFLLSQCHQSIKPSNHTCSVVLWYMLNEEWILYGSLFGTKQHDLF